MSLKLNINIAMMTPLNRIHRILLRFRVFSAIRDLLFILLITTNKATIILKCCNHLEHTLVARYTKRTFTIQSTKTGIFSGGAEAAVRQEQQTSARDTEH